jgi:hypothetical protein
MAPEVYWQCRTAAGSVREWLTLFYPGGRTDQRWIDLWGCAENIDLTLQMIYESRAVGILRNLPLFSDG